METFQGNHPYRPLTKAPDIRILQLEPSPTDEGPIQGHLVHVNLDDHPVYDALSYTWGDGKVRHQITLDGNQAFEVTYNAFQALQDLRSTTGKRRLWIDAICINQKDIEERNRQVKLMRMIYHRAAAVRTWLGYVIDPSHIMLQKLQTLNDESTPAELGDDPSIWKPMAQIKDLEYWKRVWVQQELAFAREHSIHCRKTVLKPACLIRFGQLVNLKVLAPSGGFASSWLDLSLGAQTIAGKLRSSVADGNGVLAQQGQLGCTARFKTIIEALTYSRSLDSSDPRDRVYAILGLVDGVDLETYNIDYRASVARVYVDVAAYILSTHNSLEFLGCVTDRCSGTQKALPSWVPDWSAPNPSKALPFLKTDPAEPQFDDWRARILEGGSLLSICGMGWSKICKIIQRYDPRAMGRQMPWLQEWVKLLHIDLDDIAEEEHRGEDPRLLERLKLLFSTLPIHRWEALGNTLLGLTTESVTPDRRFLGFWNMIQPTFPIAVHAHLIQKGALEDVLSEQQRKDWAQFMDLHWMLTWGRSVALLTDGSLGLVPRHATVGDEVWLIRQCRSFMLLRPAGETYEAVGPIQIEGPLMPDPIDFIKFKGIEPVFRQVHLR